MKILHICTQDTGGAGKAVLRLHLGSKSIGLKSKMLVLCHTLTDSDVVEFTRNNNIFFRIWNKLRHGWISKEFNVYKDTRPEGVDAFTNDRTIYSIGKHPLVKEAEIIHLHWIAEMLDYIEFFSSIINKPIVWTLHDMNPFTGGCHFAGACKKYETGCGSCPQLGSKNESDLSRRIWKRKQKAYEGHYIHIVTPSSWLADCAKKSLLFKDFKIEIIPYGLSTSVFKARDRHFCRELLNLPQDKTLIIFGAAYRIKRKGLEYLIQALKLLKDKTDTSGVALVIFGNCTDDSLKDIGFPVYSLGYIDDESLLSCCYSAADLFVVPSLEDNFPNTILESFACGIPIVGFDVGGILEMIKTKEIGLLAKVGDVKELSEHIIWMINHPDERQQMGLNARRLAEQEYTTELQAKRYLKLYESISKR